MSYSYAKTVTIDHTKVGSSDATDFPVLFSSTVAHFKTVANGGRVQNSNGYDIVFCSDASLVNTMNYEVEKYDASTGQLIAWVKVPTVSHTSDTVIYIGYGDATISTFQGNVTGTWNSAYKAVYHLGDGSSISLTDSTSNANTLTNNNTTTAGTGQINGAGVFASASSQSLTHADTASLEVTTAFTLSAWVKPSSFTGFKMIICKSATGGNSRDYDMDLENTTGKPRLVFTQGVSNFKQMTGTSALSSGVWSYVVGTYDGSTQRLYTNATANGTNSVSGAVDTTAGAMAIGRTGNDSSNFYDGSIDEVRISNVARGADWITAEYNNQNSPSTFYTIADGSSYVAGQYFPPVS